MIVTLADLDDVRVDYRDRKTTIRKVRKGLGGYWIDGKKVPDSVVREAMRRLNE